MIQKQHDLVALLENARDEKRQAEETIIRIRKELDTFIKQYGDLILMEKQEQEWQEKQEEFIDRRSTPEWQNWRKKFLKLDTAE